MSLEENKAFYRRYIEEFWNKGNLSFADENFALNIVIHEPLPTGSPKIENLKARATIHRVAFPDVYFAVEDIIAEGDKVAARLTISGTHKGKFMDIAPTWKQVTIREIEFARIEGGKLVELWPLIDTLGMMQQIGAAIPQSSQRS